MGKKVELVDLLHFELATSRQAWLGGRNFSDLNRDVVYRKLDRMLPADVGAAHIAEHHPIVASAMRLVESGDTDQNMLNQILNEELALFCFWRTQKVFRVTPGLTNALRQTDFRIKKGHFKLPFRSIYVTWEGSGIQLSLAADQSSIPLKGAYIYETTEHPSLLMGDDMDSLPKKYLRFLFVSEHSTSSALLASRERELDVESGTAVSEDGMPMELCGAGNIFWIFKRWDDSDTVVSSKDFVEGHTERIDPNMRPHELMNLAINTVLYLGSPGADTEQRPPPSSEIVVPSGKKARKALKRKGKCSSLPYVVVGRSMQSPAGVPGGGRSKYAHQFDVRGHWRHQAHGEGNAQRRWTWIKPYRKNRDAAKLFHKSYRVVADREEHDAKNT